MNDRERPDWASTATAAERFAGVLAPVITPFAADLSPDRERFARHCQWLAGQGAALAIFGTNSEANSLSVAEKRALLEATVAAGIAPGRLMPGTGSCALPDAVELTRAAVTAGCRGVLTLPPFYYKPVSDDGLFAFVAELIERVGSAALRIYLYHYPQMSAVPFSLDLIERLVRRYPDTIAGIKDSSGDWDNIRAMLARQWDDFRVFCGSETLLLQTLRAGGAGCISATANVNPAAMARLCQSWRDPEADPDGQQQALNGIRQVFQALPMVAALKGATAHYGGDAGWRRLRPPLLPLSGEQEGQLLRALRQRGFAMAGLTAGDSA